MFKKIQKYLLINHPLLWNTKIVPITCFLVFAHIIFFAIGYVSGKLDFTETEQNYSDKSTEVMVFFSVLIAILALIVWLVFYFKNNGFKSFYPKSNWALFKEWSMLLIVSILLCSLHLSYLKGYDTRVKSYYSEAEAKKRCETISEASIFYGQNYDEPNKKDSIINDTTRVVNLDYVLFNKKKYSLESLINKDNDNFSFYDSKWDSLSKNKVKNWLINAEEDSIKSVMKAYFMLIKEHNLISNSNEDKWFTLVYTPPTFIQSKVVARRKMVSYNDHYYEYADVVEAVPEKEAPIDTLNQYVKMVNKEKFVYNKRYVPADELEYNYQKIAITYTNPSASFNVVLVSLYFAFALSILLFTFRVTSGRNWLITLISLGIFNVLLAIITAMRSTGFIYMIGISLLTLALAIYFVIVLIRKTKKGVSAIALNGLLWLSPSFIPIIYNLILMISRDIYPHNYDYFKYYQEHPTLKWMNDNIDAMAWANLLFVVLVILILSFKIKKWKGIAEN